MGEKLSDEQLREICDGGPENLMHKIARELIALRARCEKLEGALIEATAELIYLRQYGKDGAVWWANDSKDVWRGKAIATLSEPPQ